MTTESFVETSDNKFHTEKVTPENSIDDTHVTEDENEFEDVITIESEASGSCPTKSQNSKFETENAKNSEVYRSTKITKLGQSLKSNSSTKWELWLPPGTFLYCVRMDILTTKPS